MILKLGNLSPEVFASRVGAEFTPEESAYLKSVWSQHARLTGPDDFHIFDAPAITISVGAADSKTVEAFKAANERKPFNRPINFYLDNEWQASA